MEKHTLELEKRMVHLEKFVEELNEVIIDQQKQLDRMQKELALIKTRTTPSPIDSDRPHDEKPPHY